MLTFSLLRLPKLALTEVRRCLDPIQTLAPQPIDQTLQPSFPRYHVIRFSVSTKSMPSLPLLRLPQLALTEVLRCLDPIELFIFAQTSSKASAVVPLAKTKSFRIDLNNELKRRLIINDDYFFSLENFDKDQSVDSKRNSINCSVKRKNGYMLTINSDYRFEPFIWYFCNLFNSSIRNVNFLPNNDFHEIIQFLSKVAKKEVIIEEFEICGSELSSEILKKTLNALQNINLSLALSIRPTVPRGFTYNFIKLPERLQIKDSHWFSMANLLQASNCAHIDLNKSSLTIQDMREFISRWKQGEFPNLEYLQVSNRSFDIRDYPDFADYRNQETRIKAVKNCYYERFIRCGVRIQRDNGQKAEYCIYDNWFKFFVYSEWDI